MIDDNPGQAMLIVLVVCVVALVILFFALVTLGWIAETPNFISNEQTLDYLHSFIDGETDIRIIEHSNTSFPFGDPTEVTYVLEVKYEDTTEYINAECSDAFYEPFICRVWEFDSRR